MNRIREIARRLIDLLVRIRTSRTHPAVYAFAVAVFIAFGALALSRFPADEVDDPTLWPVLVLIVAAVPANIVINSLEYRLQARIVDVEVAPAKALRVSVLATASNMLPIPGSILIRTTSLVEHAGAKRASATSAAIGLVWLGVTLLPASVAISLTSGLAFGAVLGVVGLLTLAGGSFSIAKMTDKWQPLLGRLLLVEASTVAMAGLRFWLVLRAIGFRAEVAQLVPLTMAGALASASGFLPAGIGVRESAAAGIAAIVDIPPSVGYIAAAGDTLATVIVIGILAGVLVMGPRLGLLRRAAR